MKKIQIIITAVMVIFAVEGYAQRYIGHHHVTRRVKNVLHRTDVQNGFKHGKQYHPTACRFENSEYVRFGEYVKRFRQNTENRNEYFDEILGYYVYGRLSGPKELEIDDIIIYRKGDYIIVKDESYNMFDYSNRTYYTRALKVTVITDHGYAKVYIEDDLCNRAVYKF